MKKLITLIMLVLGLATMNTNVEAGTRAPFPFHHVNASYCGTIGQNNPVNFLNWDFPSCSYQEVYRGTGTDIWGVTDWSLEATLYTNQKSYIDDTVNFGNTYTYVIVAYDDCNNTGVNIGVSAPVMIPQPATPTPTP